MECSQWVREGASQGVVRARHTHDEGNGMGWGWEWGERLRGKQGVRPLTGQGKSVLLKGTPRTLGCCKVRARLAVCRGQTARGI